MNEFKAASIDPEIMSGEMVFSGTRVPVENLFESLTDGRTVQEFLDSYPTVKANQVDEVLAYAYVLLKEKIEGV